MAAAEALGVAVSREDLLAKCPPSLTNDALVTTVLDTLQACIKAQPVDRALWSRHKGGPSLYQLKCLPKDGVFVCLATVQELKVYQS